jgi:transcriptional regulator GlxA family with amidase domain
MRRKEALIGMATLAGALSASAPVRAGSNSTHGGLVASVPNRGKPLRRPVKGPVVVGFLVGPDLVTIDLFGPMAAFGDANMFGQNMSGLFDFFTVAESMQPVDVNGMKSQPNYSFENAPQPRVLVVPAQRSSAATIDYIKRTAVRTDVTMSVCTGAFLVAKAGLFDGGRATTHHDGWQRFEELYPNVLLIRGPRFVEDRNVSSSAGESSGIDLALRVVERYYGDKVADGAAYNMEYRRTRRPSGTNDV